MKNRLILIEGIPGSGKSTISSKVRDYLESKGVKVKLYNEGEAHPADMAWNAYLSIEEYNEILKNNPNHEKKIRENSTLEEDYAVVAYTKLGFGNKENELMKFFQSHEVCDGRVSLELFKELHFKRWRKFAKTVDKDSIVIFECSYLQNHVNELMGVHNKDTEFIINYMIDLIKTVEDLKPKLIYLSQQDINETISRVSDERRSSNKEIWPDWIDMVIEYVENSKYGKANKLEGFEGVIDFLKARKEIELKVIEKLNIDKNIVFNKDYNWERVLEDVIESLNI